MTHQGQSPLYRSPQDDAMDYDSLSQSFMSPATVMQDFDDVDYAKRKLMQSITTFDNTRSPDMNSMHLYDDFAASPHLGAAPFMSNGYVGPMDISHQHTAQQHQQQQQHNQRHSMFAGGSKPVVFFDKPTNVTYMPVNGAMPMSAPADIGFHNRAMNLLAGSPQHGQHQPMDMPPPTTEDEYTQQANLQAQMERRRRRRESHNAVERRRRENINDRIQELGSLLPEHMLEEITSTAQGQSPTSSSTAPVKPNKGAILRKSVEHIRDLQEKTSSYKQRVLDLERMLAAYNISIKQE